MQGTFSVQVCKDYLVFASAHFLTFRGHQCESLHGHNYRVGVAIEGGVDAECLFVVDFSVVKKCAKRLIDPIDHKVLLPLQNPKLAFHEKEGDMLQVDYFGKPTYLFPKRDVALLPIQNSTAEMLAEWLAKGIRDELHREGYRHLTRLEVEVEENFGQSATYTTALTVD